MNISRTLVATIGAAACVLTSPILLTPAHAGELTCFGRTPTIVGTADADTIHGTAEADVIAGGDGADEIYGEGGNDLICGGASASIDDGTGVDQLHGGQGDDRVDGGAGPDTLYGEDGADVLYGRDGDDVLDDGGGNDTAFGGTGVDLFNAGEGDDVMVGGPDSEPSTVLNAVSYRTSSSPVVVDLRTDQATGNGDDLVKHIWSVTGSEHDDVIRGTRTADSLSGGCGNDQLVGLGGDDSLDGNASDSNTCSALTSSDDDTIHGGGGADDIQGAPSGAIGTDAVLGDNGDDRLHSLGNREQFSGGAGTDTFTAEAVDLTGDRMRMDLEAGTYTIGDNTGAVADVENVIGTLNDDIVYGDDEANTLIGLDGPDRLYGRGGGDVLRGDHFRVQDRETADVAFGGPGTDSCRAEVKKSCELR